MPPARCGSTSARALVARRCWPRPASTDAHAAPGRRHRGRPAALRRKSPRDWGMDARRRCAGGGGDNAAGAAGIGVVAPATPSCRSGTSGVLFVATPKFLPESRAAVHAFCHCLPDTLAPDERDAVGGQLLRRLGGAAHRRQRRGRAARRRCEKRAGADGPAIFLPYLSGERTPHNDPQARGVFFGLDHDTTPGQSARRCSKAWPSRSPTARRAPRRRRRRIDTDVGHRRRRAQHVVGADARRQRSGGRSIYREASEVGPALGAARLARLATAANGRRMSAAPPPVRVVARTRAPAISSDWRQAPDTFSPALPARFAQDSALDVASHCQPTTMTSSYFSSVAPIRFEGPKSTNRVAFRYYTRTRSSSASAWKTSCASPCATGTRSPGTASTSSATTAPSSVRGPRADRWTRPRWPRWTRRSISSPASARRSTASTTAT